MDLVQIYHKANILIAQTYGITVSFQNWRID